MQFVISLIPENRFSVNVLKFCFVNVRMGASLYSRLHFRCLDKGDRKEPHDYPTKPLVFLFTLS